MLLPPESPRLTVAGARHCARRFAVSLVAMAVLAGCAIAPGPPVPLTSPLPRPYLLASPVHHSIDLAAETAHTEGAHQLRARAVIHASAALHAARALAAPPLPWACAQNDARLVANADERVVLKARSDADALAEWRTRPILRRAVRRGLGGYQLLRWLYLRRGVCDVPAFFEGAIVPTRFLGLWLQVHREVADRLARVERLLRKQDAHLRIARIGGFVPRTLRGPYGSLPWLSNHAFGLAVDIDPHRNPYLSIDDLVALERVSGVKLVREASVPAGDRWDRFVLAQRTYRARIGPWLRDNAAAIHDLRLRRARGDATVVPELDHLERLRKLVTGSARLRAAVRVGFLTLPRELVVAMEDAGFTWCTDFPNGADLMHFELRRPR